MRSTRGTSGTFSIEQEVDWKKTTAGEGWKTVGRVTKVSGGNVKSNADYAYFSLAKIA
jgi:hypothetical protein